MYLKLKTLQILGVGYPTETNRRAFERLFESVMTDDEKYLQEFKEFSMKLFELIVPIFEKETAHQELGLELKLAAYEEVIKNRNLRKKSDMIANQPPHPAATKGTSKKRRKK